MDLVTGATGFIGAAVVRHLLARGHQVRALVREPQRLPQDLAAEAEAGRLSVARADLRIIDGLRDAASGCTRAFHCAGLPAWAPAVEQLPAHGAATHNLLLACRAAELQRVVVVSALAAADPPAGDAYATAKAVQEDVAADFRRHGLDVVVVRPAPVFGPGGRSSANELAAHVARGRLRRYPAGSDRRVSCTYVRDLGALLVRIADWGEPAATYSVATETVSLQRLIDRICRLSGRQAPGGGGLRVTLARLLREAPPLPPEWQPGGPVANPGTVFAELGLFSTDPETAWAETVRWVQAAPAGVLA